MLLVPDVIEVVILAETGRGKRLLPDSIRREAIAHSRNHLLGLIDVLLGDSARVDLALISGIRQDDEGVNNIRGYTAARSFWGTKGPDNTVIWTCFIGNL